MLLNIASFILMLMFCLTVPGGVWLVHRGANEPGFVSLHRKKLLWLFTTVVILTVVSTVICMYEISLIQERLRLP